ncbi:MAG TPA: hypothetical protein VHW70_14220 [Edaphobacter sp.]|nr:hypothetical protein [Edaphobacter sp.]
MAEAILNHKGKGMFTAYSAGSYSSGAPRPEALEQIESSACRRRVCAANRGMSL